LPRISTCSRACAPATFADGAHVLRAKIDMAAPTSTCAIRRCTGSASAVHQRTGDAWCIYPMYDFAHTISDALEGITHSLCTLEFEDHRPLYDWLLDQLTLPAKPRQIEFSRLNLAYTVTSKRKLAELIALGHVSGWDDPRMPTIAGMRRRGYPPAALRDFVQRIGVTKKETPDPDEPAGKLRARGSQPARAAGDGGAEPAQDRAGGGLEVQNHPQESGHRHAAHAVLTREIVHRPRRLHGRPAQEVPPPGRRAAKCACAFPTSSAATEVIKDADGAWWNCAASYDAGTAGGQNPEGRKVKGIIHWASATHGASVEVRLVDRLFNVPDPAAQDDFLAHLNPDSLVVVHAARAEPALLDSAADSFQFERVGYFCRDQVDSRADAPVFIRTVTLRDTWARINEGDGA
jgi:glutaminyl-tRNA synthetase